MEKDFRMSEVFEWAAKYGYLKKCTKIKCLNDMDDWFIRDYAVRIVIPLSKAQEFLGKYDVEFFESREAEGSESIAEIELHITADMIEETSAENSFDINEDKFEDTIKKDEEEKNKMRIMAVENPSKKIKCIFHGGCIGCIEPLDKGIGYCAGCEYFKFDHNLPDLSTRNKQMQ